MEELEVLESIYMDDMKVSCNESDFPMSITILLHPATGDELDKRYVCMTLTLNLPQQYPDVVPDIVITNPRGMADEEVQSLLQALENLAEERKGSDMLYEIIELAKDSLTEGNIPYCACTICYEHFTEDDLFTKTDCYHYFHKSCLQRYVHHMTEVIKQEEANQVKHSQADEQLNQIKCPVCREEITYESDFLEADFSSKGDNNVNFKPTNEMQQWQKDMKELYQRQKDKGGIIDVEAEKNRYLLTESDMDVPVIVTKPEEDITDNSGDKKSDENQGRKSPVIKFNQSGKGRGTSSRGSPMEGKYYGSRGGRDRPFSSRFEREGDRTSKNERPSSSRYERDGDRSTKNDRPSSSRYDREGHRTSKIDRPSSSRYNKEGDSTTKNDRPSSRYDRDGDRSTKNDKPSSSRNDQEGDRTRNQPRKNNEHEKQDDKQRAPNDRHKELNDDRGVSDREDEQYAANRVKTNVDKPKESENNDKQRTGEKKDLRGNDKRPSSRRDERQDFRRYNNDKYYHNDRGYNDRPFSGRTNQRGGYWRNRERGKEKNAEPDGNERERQNTTDVNQKQHLEGKNRDDERPNKKDSEKNHSNTKQNDDCDKSNSTGSIDKPDSKDLGVGDVTKNMASCSIGRTEGDKNHDKPHIENNSRGRGQRKHAGDTSRESQGQVNEGETRPGQSRRHDNHHGNQGYYRGHGDQRSYGHSGSRGQGYYKDRKDHGNNNKSRNEKPSFEEGSKADNPNKHGRESDRSENEDRTSKSQNNDRRVSDCKTDGVKDSHSGNQGNISKPSVGHLEKVKGQISKGKDRGHERIQDKGETGNQYKNDRHKQSSSAANKSKVEDKSATEKMEIKVPGFEVKGPPPSFKEKSIKPPPGF